MGNDISDDKKINFTYFNFCLVLCKEIGDYIYSFFRKRIKQFSLSPEAKDYEESKMKYIELKENKENIYFDSYIEDILEFDSNFNTIFGKMKKSDKFIASRRNFIMLIKSSPYYILSHIKFILKIIILIIYFYKTIKVDNYVCSYNLAFNYTKTNNSVFSIINKAYINYSYSNNNSFGNDLFNNYCNWQNKLEKCKVEKVIFSKIKILRVVYFILFDLPLIFYGICFLKTFKKFKFKIYFIILYQVSEYILLLIIFIVNLRDTQSCFNSKDNPKIFYKDINYDNILFILCDKIFNKLCLN